MPPATAAEPAAPALAPEAPPVEDVPAAALVPPAAAPPAAAPEAPPVGSVPPPLLLLLLQAVKRGVEKKISAESDGMKRVMGILQGR